MRIWDLPPRLLCRKHLLGEHNELHIMWKCITEQRSGWANHPETQRWRGRLAAMYRRHDALVREMHRRGFNHKSPLDKRRATGVCRQRVLLQSRDEQIEILRDKGCDCGPF